MKLRSRTTRRAGVSAILASLLLAGIAGAIVRNRAPTTSSAEEEGFYDQAARAAEAGRCGDALPLLERATAETPDDPDAWNLFGFCLRKSGDLEGAFASYARALELRPVFPEARQYLGEAHLQAVRREIEILRGYGAPGREALELLVAALRDATRSAAAVRPVDAVPPAPW